MAEIDLILEGNITVEPQEVDQPTIPGNLVRVTSPGDIWRLNKHRILCGNALETESYLRLMGKQRAGVGFADAPYNVPILGHASGLGKIKHQNFLMASGELSESQFIDFLRTTCRLLARFSRDGAIHFFCMDWRHLSELLQAGREAQCKLLNVCCWVKTSAGMGSFYRSQHELVLVFKSGKGSHRNNVDLGRHGRNRTNVWNYPGANTFSRSTEEIDPLSIHPTPKPVNLVSDALLDCSLRGDIVLDPFLGSGTTIIAAETVGRICFGLELDPSYVDASIRRWQRLTGLEAVCETSGRSFNDLEMEAADKQ